MKTFPPLFTMEDLESTFQWISDLREKYSPHSDIWYLRRDWEHSKDQLFTRLNEGSYLFSPLDRYAFEGTIISLWSSQDMIALKLIAQALGQQMAPHISKSCYHVKGHGGLKKAVYQTCNALPKHQYVMRSDIKSYYESIRFDILREIIERYVTHPVLLKLVYKACSRTKMRGGVFYDYHTQGIPKGSPLSPLLGAIALIPLDQAMEQIKGIFYSRFMDDWVVLTRSKSALRKIIKITHKVLNALKLHLHPLKTYIGKISHGFNFLAYYMDHEKILPSCETIRRFYERMTALYEQPQTGQNISQRYRKSTGRDISIYPANEAAPSDVIFKRKLSHLWSLAAQMSDVLARMRRYLGQWVRWLKSGLSTLEEFATSIQTLMPSIYSCWMFGKDALSTS